MLIIAIGTTDPMTQSWEYVTFPEKQPICTFDFKKIASQVTIVLLSK
jgi:hypothetical protein